MIASQTSLRCTAISLGALTPSRTLWRPDIQDGNLNSPLNDDALPFLATQYPACRDLPFLIAGS